MFDGISDHGLAAFVSTVSRISIHIGGGRTYSTVLHSGNLEIPASAHHQHLRFDLEFFETGGNEIIYGVAGTSALLALWARESLSAKALHSVQSSLLSERLVSRCSEREAAICPLFE
jgi:hypothetical protein